MRYRLSGDGETVRADRTLVAKGAKRSLGSEVVGMKKPVTEAFRSVVRSRTVIDLAAEDAKAFFLKPESYCKVDLPEYISFRNVMEETEKALRNRRLSDLEDKKNGPRVRDCSGVNYTILTNKDGRYAWRPYQLIHPALYVSLVNAVTEESNWNTLQNRIAGLAHEPKIQCLSLPVVAEVNETDKAKQVSQWWRSVEQRSIELSLDYEYLYETDIVDCYSSMYTHSIAWALHGKEIAKSKKQCPRLLGNVIDRHIQDMRNGQTNGIPQGSVLMDLCAELVLALADDELAKKIKNTDVTDYEILRFRDDYRVFVNAPRDGEQIIKLLSEVLSDLGLKLGPEKTRMSGDVISASIKKDKRAWLNRKQGARGLQKHLLIIHDHALGFPNEGSLITALGRFHARVSKCKSIVENPVPMISIVVDIACRNPRVYPRCAAILSDLISFVECQQEKEALVRRIKTRFSKVPNIGHLEIWLQRFTLTIDQTLEYEEPLCQLVLGPEKPLWNSDWIQDPALKRAIAVPVIDQNKIDTLKPRILTQEIDLFQLGEDMGYS